MIPAPAAASPYHRLDGAPPPSFGTAPPSFTPSAFSTADASSTSSAPNFVGGRSIPQQQQQQPQQTQPPPPSLPHPDMSAQSYGNMANSLATPNSSSQVQYSPNPLSQQMMLPYPQPLSSPPVHMNAPAQSQVVCMGCHTLLLYPNNATNVRCALCSTITPVPAAGTEMSQMICGGCRTLLMYVRGATSVQCSCCHTVNLSMESNPVAHVNCGGCGMTLMYASGALSVKCAVCQFVTNVSAGQTRMPLSMQRPQGASPAVSPYTPQQQTSQMTGGMHHPSSQTQPVVVENLMSMDETGKLVSNVAVGVATDKM
eukprot:TRINITY_DN8287_c0_g1_i1.p1 TRINITY_DN8287_c0_g1~~TRINITY_DN8287_c0_g1_i1.p1  ORF type:complete len:313 (-),score=47.46 TRINITY_DN8287_c0_g1_i1:360-1298(-)